MLMVVLLMQMAESLSVRFVRTQNFSDNADYCRICGTSRRNLCVPQFDQAPEHENPSNARYCEYCGAPTVFFNLKLLKPWDKVPAEMKKEALDSEPAVGFTAVETDELPF